jgi:multiple sugar transport system permease protein
MSTPEAAGGALERTRPRMGAAALAARRPRLRIGVARLLFLALALFITFLAVMPFLLTVSGSLKTPSEILDWPPTLIPSAPRWENYVEVWNNSRYFPQWIANSVFVSGAHLVGYLTICSLAGYAFARMKFPGATVIFLAVLGSLMVPGQVLWVPKFIILKTVADLGGPTLIDSVWGIILPEMAEVFGVFFMTQFFKSLPRELEEAAAIDGASRFRTFWQVIIPNAVPGIAALAILRFQAEWNAFQWPLIVVRQPQTMTLPLGLASFQGLFGVHWHWVLAGAMFNAVPMILLVILFQRYFIRSATSSAIKG